MDDKILNKRGHASKKSSHTSQKDSDQPSDRALYQSHDDPPVQSKTHGDTPGDQRVLSQNYYRLDRTRRGKSRSTAKIPSSCVAGGVADPLARWIAQDMDDEPYHNIKTIVSYDEQLAASGGSDNTGSSLLTTQDTRNAATYGSSQHSQKTHK